MFSIGNITGRIVEQQQDYISLWIMQTMKGQQGQRISIISAYQVVSDSQSIGLTTLTAQQRAILTQTQDSTIANPRKAFKKDLQGLVLQMLITRG
jgi:hypothetical protein